MLQASPHSVRADFARIVSQKFGPASLLIVSSQREELERQFQRAEARMTICGSAPELSAVRSQNGQEQRFDLAIWLYPADSTEDDRVTEELTRRANEVVLIPGEHAQVSKRRPRLIERFRSFGLIPDYHSDLSDLDAGAIRLTRTPPAEPVPGVEVAFARLTSQMRGLERSLKTRVSELKAADRHIAELEEKLLKFREAKRELKQVKKEKHTFRKSPERKIGQLLLAPYRLPERLIKTVWKRMRPPHDWRDAPATPYQEWFQRHRATADDLDAMRNDARAFASQPLISIIMPVFDTPGQWLEEAVQSVLAQVYENWELLMINDASSAPDLLQALPGLAARDKRIAVMSLDQHQGISAASNRGLEQARGEWIGLLDHDDILEPDALFQTVKLLQEQPEADIIYSDEDKVTEQGFDAPLLKPDWSPDFFLSYNYIGHFTTMRRKLVVEVGGFRSEFDSAQDYDLFLRVVARTSRIHHIPRILYHWRRSANSVADSIRSKPTVLEAARHAIDDHLRRRSERGHVAVDWRTHTFWVRRELLDAKRISIIIPAGDSVAALSRCLESLSSKTDYSDYEVVVVANKRNDSAELRSCFSQSKHRLLIGEKGDSSSALNNFAIQQTESPWLLFLDNKIEMIEADWLIIMAEHVQRSEVGAVGARLLYSDDTVKHAGVVLGAGGTIDYAFRGLPAEAPGVNRQLQVTRNCSAVSGACLFTRRNVLNEVGGFDEKLPPGFNDLDLCLKMRHAGYLIVYTPFAKLYHHDPTAVPCDGESAATEVIRKRWPKLIAHDPYYNPNLCRERADFSLGN